MYSEEYEDEELDNKSSNSFIVNFYNNNKVLVWIFLGIIAFIILMSLLTGGGKSNSTTPTTDSYTVIINPTEETVAIGKSVNILAYVKEDSKANIVWSVEDSNIAKVDGGNVVGLNYGQTKVIATYIDSKGEKYSAASNITVANGNPNIKLTNAEFKDGDLFMPLNSTYQIALVLTPAMGYVENESFTSSNSLVATVNNEGVVTSVGEGEATITFNVNNGLFRGELHVYVSRDYTRTEIILTPEKITLDGELRKIKVGTTSKLNYTLVPQNADSSKLSWKSDDESILTVDDQGYVTARSEGTATVTVTAVNGIKDKINIEVESDIVPVTDIILSLTEISLTVGQSQTIVPTISPDNASNKALSYAVADGSVADVTANDTGTQATITAISVGSTTLVIRSAEGVERSINITVTGSNSDNQDHNQDNYSSDDKTIVVRSNDNNLAKSYSEVLNKYAAGPSTVNVTIHSGVAKIKYCLSKNYNVECTPNTEMSSSGSITVPNGSIYLLCIKKFDRNGNEISGSSTSTNYSNGLLHYYINTLGNGGKAAANYNITGTVYDTMYSAQSNPYTNNATLTFSTTAADGVKVCYRLSTDTNNTCRDTKGSFSKTFTSEGTWIITIMYPGTTQKIATKYFTIKKSSALTPVPTTSATCNPPSNVSVSTLGKVSWTSASGATGYQIQIDSNGWKNATYNGGDYKSAITYKAGTRAVSVRSVCNGAVSSTSEKTYVNVYTVTLNKGTGIDTVSGGGNYISGSSVKISATVLRGYEWKNWTGSVTTSTREYTISNITSNKTFTANATANSGALSITSSYAYTPTDANVNSSKPSPSSNAVNIQTTFGRVLGIRVEYSSSASVDRMAYAGSYDLSSLRNLKLSNFVSWYIGRDAGRVRPKIEKASNSTGTKCIGKIGDLRASNEYNFAFDLDELDQIGNGAYSDNKKNSPYYVAIWLVNRSGEMSKPTIFKVNTNGERDCAKWTVSKVQ